MSVRWLVEHEVAEDFGDVAVWRVWQKGAARWTGGNVWVVDGIPRCVECQGPLVAMLSTCPHARAVKRAMARTA